jgi:competence protein ComEC
VWAVLGYVLGLFSGFSNAFALPVLAIASVGATVGILRAVRTPAGSLAFVACALLCATGVLVARDANTADRRCIVAISGEQRWTTVHTGAQSPCDVLASAGQSPSALERWRAHAGVSIDSLFGVDAPLVRALLIADTGTLPSDVRDRFAAAGLVHILSISGLHVAIIAEAIWLFLQAVRVRRTPAKWVAFALTALYVAAIGAPPPALRSAAMLGVATASRALGRPVSPWAVLALGAAIPLVDPRVVTQLGWQLSVAGFAALIAAGIWVKRRLPRSVRGWRRALARDLIVSTLATVVTAPLIAWTFGRISLIAPLSNLAAGPIVALLQPALFLALLLAPLHSVAAFVAAAAHPLLVALDAVAGAAAAIPFASVIVSPSLGVAVCGAVASAALVVAASNRHSGLPLNVAAGAVACCLWWPLAPVGSGMLEFHVIDVGQGDAIAVRTPHGHWILTDAGRMWNGGDAARSTVIPYLRRRGGDLALFILSHPHADHVGGAASVLKAFHPAWYRDAAFAGGSNPYHESLITAQTIGVPWSRVHPGDSVVIDGVIVRFLAPDSVWTAGLTDPNLASTIALVRYGQVRFLLTGDAEAPEEDWLLAHESGVLHADVLKVGHHGSSTSSTAGFLDAVQPRVAVVSVGVGNSYGHPDKSIMQSLLDRGVMVLRTDMLGNVVLRTDGRALEVATNDGRWLPVIKKVNALGQ